MFRKFIQNAGKPQGFMGKMLLRGMNSRHAPLVQWGLSYLDLEKYDHILDVGCGGGANIAKMLRDSPKSTVDGIDYSDQSIALSRKTNKKELGKRCTIRKGDVSSLPYPDDSIDLVTAFETVYFWPSLKDAFEEVRRVLKPGGVFLVCCAVDDADDTTWTSMIDGMVIYRGEALQKRLLEAGFKDVELYRKNEWICLTAAA